MSVEQQSEQKKIRLIKSPEILVQVLEELGDLPATLLVIPQQWNKPLVITAIANISRQISDVMKRVVKQ